jgi:endonuclease YncB( thermonuclease family)
MHGGRSGRESFDCLHGVCRKCGRSTLDLGTILITEGFAFAAADANGKPINFAYAVVEGDAQRARRGLWAATDLPHPTRILMDAARAAVRR